MNERVYVAKIGKTVGLKGQLKLYIDSDFPEQFIKNSKFITNKNITLTIESFNKKNNIVKFIGLDTMEDAKKVINQHLFTTLEDTKNNCKLQDKQYFWFDLIGCEIIENNKQLGKVIDIHRYPQGDYFEIETDEVLINSKGLAKKFLLPYIDQYILNVDIDKKTIYSHNALDILEAS